MEIFFEHFDVQNYFVSVDAVCSLVAAGLRTGLVIDFGWEVTNVVPIYESSTLNNGIQSMNYGTRDVIRHMNSELLYSTEVFTEQSETAQISMISELIKQKCYFSLN